MSEEEQEIKNDFSGKFWKGEKVLACGRSFFARYDKPLNASYNYIHHFLGIFEKGSNELWNPDCYYYDQKNRHNTGFAWDPRFVPRKPGLYEIRYVRSHNGMDQSSSPPNEILDSVTVKFVNEIV